MGSPIRLVLESFHVGISIVTTRSLKSSKRLLLKLSGEILSGSQGFGIDPKECHQLSLSIKSLVAHGLEIGIVIGGGNIFRGSALRAMDIPQVPADQMGMLATLINGISLQQSLERVGCPSKLLSALECPRVCETYTWAAATNYLHMRQVVIFVGGTGNPYFTTDTAAALRASEIGADVLVKATKVDGIYEKDPLLYPSAKRYENMTYHQVISDQLQIMDATAVMMCAKAQIPIFVCNMKLLQSDRALDLLDQSVTGTWVASKP